MHIHARKNKESMATIIETERLIIRTWQESDIEPFIRMNQDPLVMHFQSRHLTPEETRANVALYAKHHAQHGFGIWAVEHKETGAFIGRIGISIPTFPNPCNPCVMIGWFIASNYWGSGYATEGAQAVLDYAFTVLNIEEVVSFASASNAASINLMQKLGMHRDVAG